MVTGKRKSRKLSHPVLLKINNDPVRAARAADLAYVRNDEPGITRIKKGKKFIYFSGKKRIKDKATLERIRKLAIPPSWKNIWISASPNGHIQATGLDLKGRKQYRYHARWNELRNETKFHHLYEFGRMLPKIRKRIRKDINNKELTREKVLATVIDLMDKTYIRIGNSGYEKMNGSYGLTTLKDKHVSFNPGGIIFSFTGKKGVGHTIKLKDKKLAKIVKECRDIPGRTLFQYYDTGGVKKSIDSGMVNNYIKEMSGLDFSAKDFRTWAGSVQAVGYLRGCDTDVDENLSKKNVIEMLDTVSRKLGNTRNVCKKYYVHPRLLSLCEERDGLNGMPLPPAKRYDTFTVDEQMLMGILKETL